MVRFFVFYCLLGFSVVTSSGKTDTLLSQVNDDDVDYTRLFDDPEVAELFNNFNSTKNYSKFFHLDTMYGFQGNLHDFSCYWANACKQHFTFGNSFQKWHDGLITAMQNNIDNSNSFSYYEYFNFMQSLFDSSSLGLLPTWTWQVKDSNWFFSLGAVVEWVKHYYYYDFAFCNTPNFVSPTAFDNEWGSEWTKNCEKYKILNKFYTEANNKLDYNIFFTKAPYQYKIIEKTLDDKLYSYKDLVYGYKNQNEAEKAFTNISLVGDATVDKREASLREHAEEIKGISDQGKSVTKHVKVLRRKVDPYDQKTISNNDSGATYYVCNDDDKMSSCSILTHFLRFGLVGNISWYQNRSDPFSAWHWGLSLGLGPQFGYSRHGGVSFYNWHTAGFCNAKIKRFLNDAHITFEENIYCHALVLRPVFFFLQLEIGYNRFSFWFRLFPSPFIDNSSGESSYLIVNDNLCGNVWAKYKDVSYPMTLPEETTKKTITSNLKKNAVFNRWGFACGIKVDF